MGRPDFVSENLTGAASFFAKLSRHKLVGFFLVVLVGVGWLVAISFCTLLLFLLGQWLNFKLFGITYFVGKIKFHLFFSGSIG